VSVYFPALVVPWVILVVAGVGAPAPAIAGIVAAFISTEIAESWWRRREHQRDLANGYLPSPQEKQP
jgi:hypothetical protein